jgi:hypothetical protein
MSEQETYDRVRQLTGKLVSGVIRVEDITATRGLVLLELETMLPTVHGGIRGTILELMKQINSMPIEEGGNPTEELEKYTT